MRDTNMRGQLEAYANRVDQMVARLEELKGENT